MLVSLPALTQRRCPGDASSSIFQHSKSCFGCFGCGARCTCVTIVPPVLHRYSPRVRGGCLDEYSRTRPRARECASTLACARACVGGLPCVCVALYTGRTVCPVRGLAGRAKPWLASRSMPWRHAIAMRQGSGNGRFNISHVCPLSLYLCVLCVCCVCVLCVCVMCVCVCARAHVRACVSSMHENKSQQ